MKKEEIYVEITNEKEILRAIKILQKAGENIGDTELSFSYRYLKFSVREWWIGSSCDTRTKITLDQLEEILIPKQSNTIKNIEDYIDTNTAVKCDNSYQFMKICSLLGIEVIHEFNEKYNCVILEKGHLARCGQFHQSYKILHYSDFINEEMLMSKQSNLFVEVQDWLRENKPNFTYTFIQEEAPECFELLKQHLQNDYPKGTEIKISKDKIEIYQS